MLVTKTLHVHGQRQRVDQRAGGEHATRTRARAAAPRRPASRRRRAGSARRSGSPCARRASTSSLATSCMRAHSAPWPTRCSRTAPCAAPSAEAQALAQPARDVDRVLVVDARRRAATTSGSPAPARCAPPRARRAAQRDVRLALDGARRPRRPRARTSLGRRAASRGTTTAASFARPALGEVARAPRPDGLRLRAGDAEAAAGEVVGLPRGERHGGDERDEPQREHDPAPAPERPGRA